MKYSELAEMGHEDLLGRLRSSRRELYELRFKLAVGQQENHREIRKVRKDIAQILTAIRSQEMSGVEVEVQPAAEAVEEAAPPRRRRAPRAPKAAQETAAASSPAAVEEAGLEDAGGPEAAGEAAEGEPEEEV